MSNGKVLIVEDDEICRSWMEDLFLVGGYDVAVCRDGLQGFLTFNKETPDVVIMDIRMPYISGLEVLKIMKKANSHIPVIMTTAYTSTDIALECGKYGAETIIRKPGDIEKIISIVDTAILKSKSGIEILQPPMSDKEIIENSCKGYRCLGRGKIT